MKSTIVMLAKHTRIHHPQVYHPWVGFQRHQYLGGLSHGFTNNTTFGGDKNPYISINQLQRYFGVHLRVSQFFFISHFEHLQHPVTHLGILLGILKEYQIAMKVRMNKVIPNPNPWLIWPRDDTNPQQPETGHGIMLNLEVWRYGWSQCRHCWSYLAAHSQQAAAWCMVWKATVVRQQTTYLPA